MKLILVIVFLSALWIIDARRVRSNKVECGSSNKTANAVYCYLKAYDRNNPMVHGGFRMIRKSPNALTFLGIYRKSGYDFHSIMTFPDLPVCKLFRESKMTSTFSPFVQAMIKSFKQHYGNYSEACEKVGAFQMRNLSSKAMPLLNQWPIGQYKFVGRFFDEIDDNIVNATLILTILS